MSSQCRDTGFIYPHVANGEKEFWSEFQMPALIQHSDFISQLRSWGLGSVWHFPCHPWFSLAFIPFGFAAYTCGG